MLNPVEEHLDKLRGFLESETLDIESRLFIMNEIWDIQIDTKIAAMAGD